MARHDPLKFASGLSAKLATRSRHVCMFLGAGTARACNLPDIAQLQALVLSELNALDKASFEAQLKGKNLEQALSRLRRIAALLDGEQQVDSLTAAKAKTLDENVCQAIVKHLDIKDGKLAPAYQLAAWIARSNYLLPLELFTVNYDLILETALEKLRVPYFDGFIGQLRARFQIELVEASPGADREWVPAFFTRLWKLHGSVNWSWETDQQIVRLGSPVTKDRVAAIYPSDEKYEESRRIPFVVLQDRLRRALHMPETLMMISGYSFSDAHLNEMIFDAATRRERSEIMIFCHSDISDSLAQRAIDTPNLQVVSGDEAILGGVREKWKAPKDPAPGLWEDKKFALGDFQHLAAYLARIVTRDPDGDSLLGKLLAESAREGSQDVGTKHNG